ncbi:GAF domain-containing protein [Chitinophaga parva]|uniref:GAF domain-containing protein n=1 Tax=Chitinophaga parva TaxID=2169414 RepID=A0A2T7BMW8_9BACT|nr:GAF domain-containing protein [Chitinophaga parva]PUZ29006.1 GAF domain-containing protein [Chitinophaga parva]
MYYTSNIPASLLPDNEKERLQHLHRYKILNTAPEEDYDNIAREAMAIFNTPSAAITFIDRDTAYPKSYVGAGGCSHLPRYACFCAIAIHNSKVTVFPDTQQVPELRANPYSNGLNPATPPIRFYAGAPLRTPEGTHIGTICALDNKPHATITDEQALKLRALARQVMQHLHMRLHLQNALKGQRPN